MVVVYKTRTGYQGPSRDQIRSFAKGRQALRVFDHMNFRVRIAGAETSQPASTLADMACEDGGESFRHLRSV